MRKHEIQRSKPNRKAFAKAHKILSRGFQKLLPTSTFNLVAKIDVRGHHEVFKRTSKAFRDTIKQSSLKI